MTYVGKISRVRTTLRASTIYLVKESRSEASIFVDALNVPADPSMFLVAVRGLQEHHGVPSDRLQGRTTVVSFPRDEVDPEDEEACARAFEAVKEAAEERWGRFPVLLHGQRDGESGLFHVHLLAANVDVDTGKAMRGADHSWERLAVAVDDRIKAAGIEVTNEAARKKLEAVRQNQPHRYERPVVSRSDVWIQRRGELTVPDQIAAGLREVWGQPTMEQPATMDELREQLAAHGVGLAERAGKLTYERLPDLEDSEGKPVKVRQARVEAAQRVHEGLDARDQDTPPALPVSLDAVRIHLAQVQGIRDLVAVRRKQRQGGGGGGGQPTPPPPPSVEPERQTREQMAASIAMQAAVIRGGEDGPDVSGDRPDDDDEEYD